MTFSNRFRGGINQIYFLNPLSPLSFGFTGEPCGWGCGSRLQRVFFGLPFMDAELRQDHPALPHSGPRDQKTTASITISSCIPVALD